MHAAAIDALSGAGITVGCSMEPLRYCPRRAVTRAQMASFLSRALNLAAPDEPAGFVDVDPGGVHAAAIDALSGAGITVGCSMEPLRFCPRRAVTRAQMASFLSRALNLAAPDEPAGFVDVDPGGVHAAAIDALSGAGITVGCSMEPLRFCPRRAVTRAQMASFLSRALNLAAPDEPAGFVDVDPGGVHAAAIDALSGAGITVGCSMEPLRFCPRRAVTRAQMASFLSRALNLAAPDEPAGFVDVDPGGVHAAAIDALSGAGITVGCSMEPLRFCPRRAVTRAQMASFLSRALNLAAPDEPAGFVDTTLGDGGLGGGQDGAGGGSGGGSGDGDGDSGSDGGGDGDSDGDGGEVVIH